VSGSSESGFGRRKRLLIDTRATAADVMRANMHELVRRGWTEAQVRSAVDPTVYSRLAS